MSSKKQARGTCPVCQRRVEIGIPTGGKQQRACFLHGEPPCPGSGRICKDDAGIRCCRDCGIPKEVQGRQWFCSTCKAVRDERQAQKKIARRKTRAQGEPLA